MRITDLELSMIVESFKIWIDLYSQRHLIWREKKMKVHKVLQWRLCNLGKACLFIIEENHRDLQCLKQAQSLKDSKDWEWPLRRLRKIKIMQNSVSLTLTTSWKMLLVIMTLGLLFFVCSIELGLTSTSSLLMKSKRWRSFSFILT